MKGTKFGQNFFRTTRGRVLDSIRDGYSTVDELSRRLELTDNAVRAHLLTLERDHLIEQHGFQQGLRKPHFSYRLTPEAEQLFPKAYHALLGRLLAVMKLRLKPAQFRDILREVAGVLASGSGMPKNPATVEEKGKTAAGVLRELGGAPRIEQNSEKMLINSNSGCPFSQIVDEHPEVCGLAETLLSEMTGADVREHCERGETPRCSFELRTGDAAARQDLQPM